ncbi:MAG: hypothetical protein HQK54_05460, partial [Oligoflexales bacterium]|nr:hypothetical protein [Oligoflexales bacterium]
MKKLKTQTICFLYFWFKNLHPERIGWFSRRRLRRGMEKFPNELSKIPYLFILISAVICSFATSSGSSAFADFQGESIEKNSLFNHLTLKSSNETIQKWFNETSKNVPKVILNDADEKVALAKYTDYLEDTAGRLGINELIGDEKGNFKWSHHRKENVPSFGFTDSVYWLRYAIENKSVSRESYFLELSHYYLDYVELYVFNSDIELKIIRTGNRYPYYQRPIDHQNFVFPIKIPQNSTILIMIRGQSSTNMMFPLTIWEPEHFHSFKSRELTIFGMYYGMISVMIVY